MIRSRLNLKPMNLVALTVCIFSFALVARVSAQSAEISFNRDVRPILSDRCFHCHGPDADNQVSEFRLDNERTSWPILVGTPESFRKTWKKSELHLRIRSGDEGEQMPPMDQIRHLTESGQDSGI